MVERENLSKLSTLALRNRREGLTQLLPPLGEILRGSLTERYLTCGKPGCKCARGERHGPVWYLSVSLDQTHRTGRTVPSHQVEQVRGWIENYHRVKEVSDPLPLECTASECEPLQLVLVEGEAESRRWRQTLQRYHYLGCPVPFGSVPFCYTSLTL